MELGLDIVTLDDRSINAGAKHILLKECTHASHELKVKHCVATGTEGLKQYTYPEAALWRRGSAVVLTLKWRGHICQLSSHHDHGKPMPAALMEERIRDLRRGVAEYIVPQEGPGPIPEMPCFDPANADAWTLAAAAAAAAARSREEFLTEGNKQASVYGKGHERAKACWNRRAQRYKFDKKMRR